MPMLDYPYDADGTTMYRWVYSIVCPDHGITPMERSGELYRVCCSRAKNQYTWVK